MQVDRPHSIRWPSTQFIWDALFFIVVLIFLSLCAAEIAPVFGASLQAPPTVIVGLNRMITRDGAPGVTLIVFHDGKKLYRADLGGIDPNAQLPVASASKWMAAALVMTVVDEGKLSLDEPIERRLPAFVGTAGKITLRQILSFTSGQGGLRGLVDVRQDPRISLADSANAIAALPLQDRPGKVFRYGGPAFQVAGALVEQATGESWSRLFEERIVRPLNFEHTYWGNPLWPDLSPSEIRNPNLQGGLVTTAEEYRAFLTMLTSGGEYQGHRILSEKSIGEMERAQTRDSRVSFKSADVKAKIQYALGNWCERVESDGTCGIASSPGALGTYPWIDRGHDLYGIFFMRRSLPMVEKEIQATRKLVVQEAAIAER